MNRSNEKSEIADHQPQEEEVPNSRRDFLRGIVKQTGEAVRKGAEAITKKPAKGIVRPPGALQETEFLVACTRCGDCVTACPHGVIFMLGARTDPTTNTPALDLVNNACRLCEELPCIQACEPQALAPVDIGDLKFVDIHIDVLTCLPYQGPECGVCVSVCPRPGAIVLNDTKPEIVRDQCTGCAMCRQACVVNPSSISVHALSSS